MTMKNNLLRFFLFFSFLFASQLLNAQQCTVHNIVLGSGATENGGGPQLGQTFLACGNGEIVSISVGFQSASVGDFDLLLEVEPGSGNYISNIVASINIGSPLPTDQIMTFNLANPFPVLDDGTIYRYAIQANPTGVSNVRIKSDHPNNTYAGGQAVGSSGSYASYDFNFQVQIEPSSSGGDVPTLSEWGLIILALLLMTLGTLVLVQPNWREGLNRNS